MGLSCLISGGKHDKKGLAWDFPGGPLAKMETQNSQCQGPRV